MQFDVIIVGGGIIGILSAYECAKNGASVLLLEKRDLGSGASGCSAAMLECQTDAHRGEPFLSLARQSLALFSSLEKEVEDQTGLNFQYEKCGILNLASDETEVLSLKKEVEQEVRKGHSARWVDRETLEKEVPQLDPENKGGALFEEDGQVNGERLMSAMIRAAEKKGVKIMQNLSDINHCVEKGRLVGFQTNLGNFLGKHFVITAGAWSDQLLEKFKLNLQVVPIRGQLAVYDTPKPLTPFPLFSRKKRAYIVPKQDGYTLVGTTVEDVGFDEKTTDVAKERLNLIARSMVPAFSRATFRGMTAGLRPVTKDFLPILGPLPGHDEILMATGHYRNGILLAPITAKIVASMALGIDPKIDLRPFAPDRFLKPSC